MSAPRSGMVALQSGMIREDSTGEGPFDSAAMALPGHGAAPTAVSGEAVLCLAPIQITAKKDPREARELREPKIHPPKQKRLSSPSPPPPAQPESGSISMAASSASSTEPEARLGTKEAAVVWEVGPGQGKRL